MGVAADQSVNKCTVQYASTVFTLGQVQSLRQIDFQMELYVSINGIVKTKILKSSNSAVLSIDHPEKFLSTFVRSSSH